MNRKDGKQIKKITGLQQILIDLKPYRCDSDVYINKKIDVTELVKYMDNKKKKNSDITYFHAFLAAIAKTYYNRPKLNYFVSNRHLYEHNDIVISFVAKVAFNDTSEEVMMMVPVKDNDNIDSLSKYTKEKIDSFRNKKGVKKGANSAIDILAKLPNIIRVPLIGLFKWCDSKGLLPSSLVKDNLYYSSVIISNLGSIHCGAIYHNITNFGTCSGLIAIGEIKDEEVLINGKKEIRKMCEFGITLDERVADGYYFVKSAELLENILSNPKCLDEVVSKKIK